MERALIDQRREEKTAAQRNQASANEFSSTGDVGASSSAIPIIIEIGNPDTLWVAQSAAGHLIVAASGFGSRADSGVVINDGAWHHIAVVVNAGFTQIATFVDGAPGGTATGSGYLSLNTGDIGRSNEATGNAWLGQIDELVLWSSARYSGSYTVPTAAYTGGEGMFALYHLDGDAHDSAAINPVTTTTMTTSQVTYVTGTSVTATGTVSPVYATGTITFKDGATTLGSCAAAPLAGTGDVGNTQNPSYKGCTVPLTLAAGTHTLTAVYSGDGSYNASTSAAYVNVVSAVQTSPQPCSAMSVGLNGALNGFIPRPNDGMHQRIDGLPADPNSATLLSGTNITGLHVDFSGGKYGMYGIPYYVVDSSVTPGLSFGLANNSEGPYVPDSDVLAIWPGATDTMWIENHYSDPHADPLVNQGNGDDHLNLLDKATCADYETYHTRQRLGLNPALTATSSAIWDMTSQAVPPLRTVGLTSTEAGGLSVFEGLLRYDEAASGSIKHATRIQTDWFNCDHYRNGDCQTAFTFPATHVAAPGGHSAAHYGMRFRLKSSFDISGFSPINQAILTAWKQYGFILTDIGSRGYVSGTPDTRWDTDDLLNLQIAASNLEVVEEPTQYAPDRYPSGTAATVTSFTSSLAKVYPGQCATITAVTNGADYAIIDNANAFLRGNSNTVTVCPTRKTTYTLTPKNQFLAGDDGFRDGHLDSSSVTITVPVPVFQGARVQGAVLRP